MVNSDMVRRLRLLVAFIALVLFGISLICVAFSVWRSLQAEESLLQHTKALSLLESFVEKGRRWPKSWLEMKQFNLKYRNIDPASFDDMKVYIRVDFRASLKQIASSSPEVFPYVSVTAPTFHTASIDSLRAAIIEAANAALIAKEPNKDAHVPVIDVDPTGNNASNNVRSSNQ